MSANRIVTIRPVSPSHMPAVTFGLMGDATYGTAMGGVGGIQIVDIPRQTAVTQWFDRPPYQLVLPLVIDSEITHGREGISVEQECMTVESWQQRAPGSDQPPVLSVVGPVPGVQRQYMIYLINFEQALRDPVAGFRYQQNLRLTLYEYIAPNSVVLNSPTPAEAAAQALSASAATQSFATYIVREGETLSSIAAKLLGNYQGWLTLSQLNDIPDPNSLVPGQVIIVPQTS